MKFLVTGASGLVGHQVVKNLVDSNEKTYSCYHDIQPTSGIPIQMDLLDFENIAKVIEETKPDIIIHLAAMTNVDLCETEKDLALQINAKATEVMSRQSAKIDAFFIYISTDYVFDGNSGMKKEDDLPNPVDFYGKSKLEGEKAVMSTASRWCIARTSAPFGIHPTKYSFPLFVAENLKAKKEINIITDQFTSPTYVPNLSKMLIEIAQRKISGIIHVSGSTRISRFEMASLVADKLGLDKKLLKPVTMDSMNWKAKRPRDSSLDVSKASQVLKEKPLGIEQGLDNFLHELKL